jgi:hypothetical protein
MDAMTPEEKRTAEAIFTWLEIRAKAGQLGPVTVPALMEDAEKSALLPRLLSGREALPEPPPTAFGQPWHDIVECGHADHVLVEHLPSGFGAAYAGRVFINRFPWLIVEQAETDSYLVTWREGGPSYWLTRIKGDVSPMPWSLVRVFKDEWAPPPPACRGIWPMPMRA